MPRFGRRSREELDTCHPYLQKVLKHAIREVNFTVIQGFRDEEGQMEAFRTGKSKVRWPDSEHNYQARRQDISQGFAHRPGQPLSLGVDLAPWHTAEPHIRWERTGEFYLLAGICRGLASAILPDGWDVRLGADWDSDGYTDDQSFQDLGHIELIRPERMVEDVAA